MRTSAVLLALPALAAAHFSISSPPGRGGHDEQGTGPCAATKPSSKRATFPISGAGQILFEAGHEEAKTQVNIAIGVEDPQNDDFKVTLKDTFLQMGAGDFCWNALDLSKAGQEGLKGVKNGTLATIQVVQNAVDGKLYQCADVILVDNYVAPSSCKNATGISAVVADEEESTETTSAPASSSTTAAPTSGSEGNETTEDGPEPTESGAGGESGAISNAVVGGTLGFVVALSAMYLGL